MQEIYYLHRNVVIKYIKIIPKEREKFNDCCRIIYIVNYVGQIQFKNSKNTEKSEKYKIIILLYNKNFVKSFVTSTRLIQITVEFQFHYFVLILIQIGTLQYASIMVQLRQGDFIIIDLKFITITVFKLNMKTLIPS